MALIFCTSSIAPITPTHISGLKPSDYELKPRNVRPLQVRCKGKSELETSKGLCFTRRDMMICLTTLSASGIGLSSSPEIAEARITKKEMRRKIKEKLEMLREKAGLSKQKDNKETPPSTEDILPLVPSPFPLPNPPMGLEKSLVETTLL